MRNTLIAVLGAALMLTVVWVLLEDTRTDPSAEELEVKDRPRTRPVVISAPDTALGTDARVEVEHEHHRGDFTRNDTNGEPSMFLLDEAELPLNLFSDLADGWDASPAGLYDMTTAQWSQPGFIELTTEEARALLPITRDEIGTMPQTIFTLVGGFPSLADCERAYGSEEVRAAHIAYMRNQVLVSEMQRKPRHEQSPTFAEALARARNARDAAAERLFIACEQATTYKHWRLTARLFREWGSPPTPKQ